MTSLPVVPAHPVQARWIKRLLLAALVTLAALTVLPQTLSGQWPWSQPLEVSQIKPLQALKKTGLEVPGWSTQIHQEVNINGHPWSISEMATEQPTTDPPVSQMALLLRPQPWHSDQPGVEWVDLSGAQSWKTNQTSQLTFQVDGPTGRPITVRGRYFRGWNEQQTFAVLQWYAWPQGGDDSPGRWFWADQMSQWRTHQRMPWVAVSLLIPVAPLADVAPYKPAAAALGQQVQRALLDQVFTAAS